MESIANRSDRSAGVETTMVTVRADQQRTRNLGEVYVRLKPTDDRDLSQFGVMAKVRADVLPLYRSLNVRPQVGTVNAFGGGANAEIMFWIGGQDIKELQRYSDALVAKVKSIPGVSDVDTNLIVGKPGIGSHDRAR